jgi:hypothetical protein
MPALKFRGKLLKNGLFCSGGNIGKRKLNAEKQAQIAPNSRGLSGWEGRKKF